MKFGNVILKRFLIVALALFALAATPDVAFGLELGPQEEAAELTE